MGMPTTSIAQNPTNQPMQSHQGGKGGGKGGMNTPPVSQGAQAPESMPSMEQGYIMQKQQSMPQGGGEKGMPTTDPNMLVPDGGNMTSSLVSNQPQNGQPNPYPNTTGSWDNSSNQQPQAHMGGKGKGA